MDGKDGAPGLSELESDGPYSGTTDLGTLKDKGDNSAKVPAGGADAKPV